MPTYEYRCGKCGATFERFQSITADPIADCPHCAGKKTVERLISGGCALIFKGSGFYITDYRSSSYREAAKKDHDSSSSPTSSSTKSSSKGS